ncbi:MAG: M14 family metallopeptidase, partial [Bacteroidota bacterium]
NLVDRLSTMGKMEEGRLTTLGLTATSRNIWCLELGGEDSDQRPAVAIVAGMDAHGLLGTEISLRLAESLSKDKELLAQTTFYIIPLANPDIFVNDPNRLLWEKHTNDLSYDDDRDGKEDEDGYDDLNQDRIISMMRIRDVTGSWKPHPDDPRVMVKADPSKGEKGWYHLLTEGIDNDNDGKVNEDLPGGINLNKNLTFDYVPFADGAGAYPASSIESRALLDMLFEQWNVHTVISFSGINNLNKAWKAQAPSPQSRIITQVLPEDADVFQWGVEAYKELIPQKDAPVSRPQGGEFATWAYFHYGRYSFSTPGWWVPKVVAGENETRDIDNEMIRFLDWAEQQSREQKLWVDWTKIDHPDYPDQEVEVGGIVPYANTQPPIEMVDSIATDHLQFVKEVASMLPRLEIQNIKVEPLNGNLSRITADIYNAGFLPTHSAMGNKIRWVRKPKLQLILNSDEEQRLLSGPPVELQQPIPGDGSKRFSWLVRGKGNLVLKVGSPICGFAQEVISLR